MELRSASSSIRPGLEQSSSYTKHQSKEKKGRESAEKKSNSKDMLTSAGSNSKEDDSKSKPSVSELAKGKDSIEKTTSDGTTTRKRKRKAIQDLRFQDLVQNAAPLRKKDRKKEYLKARKMKNKKSKTDDVTDFPGREQIKFGDVVVAPPKLSFPKAQKNAVDASAERVRLQAVESYRRQRGWVDRLGVRLPDLSETPTI